MFLLYATAQTIRFLASELCLVLPGSGLAYNSIDFTTNRDRLLISFDPRAASGPACILLITAQLGEVPTSSRAARAF